LDVNALISERSTPEEPYMRIAFFLDGVPNTGGGFQQAFSTIELLIRKQITKHEILVFTRFEQSRRRLLQHGIEAIPFKHRPFNLIDRWSATLLGSVIVRCVRHLGFRRLGRHLDALLDDQGIDLAVVNEGDIGWCIGDHPLIVSVWDLDHRDRPEFPEVLTDRVFERREKGLRMMLTRALAVIADSPSSAHRIAHLYHVDLDRIIELPFLPSLAVRRHAAGNGAMTVEAARQEYHLPDHYVFYPAFFSFIKNHFYLLEGLAELERRHGIMLHAVFCGGAEQGEQEHLQQQVHSLGLTERVHFLGLVTDEHVPALYEGAIALVMPSYGGPTNLPPLEAIILGCPVICSDLPGCREQLGDAAIYCNLADPSSLAAHLATLIQNPAHFDAVRIAARRRAEEMAKIDYAERLARLFDDYAYVRRRWVWPEMPQ
jgi:glycosyltransferase involved in cell wall biosynthesis